MYGKLSDVVCMLPQIADTNSIPTATALSGLQRQANYILNGWLNLTSDATTNASGLAAIENDMTAQLAMNWHYGMLPTVQPQPWYDGILKQTARNPPKRVTL